MRYCFILIIILFSFIISFIIGLQSNINLNELTSNNGFSITGANIDDYSGTSVSNAGDFNGDGYDDFVIGSPKGYISYVIYGSASGNYNQNIDLKLLTVNQGFSFYGGMENGYYVSSAGDMNGDGYSDVIIGVPNKNDAGKCFVLFGASSGLTNVAFDSLPSNRGFSIVSGINCDPNIGECDVLGRAVSSAGDVNGDGIDDIMVGVYGAGDAGIIYIIYGKTTGLSNFILSTLTFSQGYCIIGSVKDSNLYGKYWIGLYLSNAGDINNDGYDDIILSAPTTHSTPQNLNSGTIFVIYGSEIRLSNIVINHDFCIHSISQGFCIYGVNVSDFSGTSLSSIGDVNGDGYDDILIG